STSEAMSVSKRIGTGGAAAVDVASASSIKAMAATARGTMGAGIVVRRMTREGIARLAVAADRFGIDHFDREGTMGDGLAAAKPFLLVPVAWILISSTVQAAAPPEYVYVANSADATVSAFRSDPETGTLTAVAGSPFADGLSAAVAVVVEPSNRFLYAV